MLRHILAATAIGMFALPALAADAQSVLKSMTLKDGSTVHVFGDGKMAMENAYGRVVPMNDGHVMIAKDGKNIAMNGNETARLEAALRPQYLY